MSKGADKVLIQNILKEKDQFSYVEGLVADYILMQQNDLANQSARFIAKQINTAPSTVIRLCQKIGYEGFNDFKQAFLREIEYLSSHFDEINPNYPFDYNDKNVVVANKMGQLYHEIINDTLSLIDHDILQASINILKKAKTIYVCSSGVQIDIAKTFKDKMLKIGKNVIVESKIDEAFYMASFCESDSVFLMISYSGETENTIKIAKKLIERNIPMIAITTYGGNSLSKLANYTLAVSTREKLISNLGSFSMNLSTLFLLDILYMNIFNDNFQTNFNNKTNSSKEFEKFRKSNNPMLKDE